MATRNAKPQRVSVSIRIRPLNARERSHRTGAIQAFRASSSRTLTEFDKESNPKPGSTQEFDNVFDTSTSTEDIFDKVAKNLVNSVLGGINGTIFAYGQTSSGKTFTMNGDDVGDSPGLLPLSALHIFDSISNSLDREFLLRVSFMEIYNEVLTDLLNPRSGSLRIRESRARGVFVDATERIISSFDELMVVFANGNKNRHVGSTAMNDRSSRSHTIFRVTIESKRKNLGAKDDVDGAVLLVSFR